MAKFTTTSIWHVALFVGILGQITVVFPCQARAQEPVTEAAPAANASSDELVWTDSCQPVTADSASYVSPFEGNLWDRPYLLGNAGGFRDGLAQHGVLVNVSSTQFYQGVTSGGVRQGFEYSGRMDYFVNVDGEKAGLWKGFFVALHGETRYGNAIILESGTIIPPNSGILFPAATGTETALTGVKFTQALSESFVTFAGKINTLDDLKQPFAGGRGVDAFMNLGLAFPPAAARTVPYSTLGAGFALLKELQPVFTFMVLDTNNTPTTSGFESFFDSGATVVAKLDIPVTLLERPGHQGVWGTYSTGSYNNLQPTAYFDPSTGPVLAPGGQVTGSWSLNYSADQAIYVDPSNPQRSWGVFTNIGLADDGPSPIRWAANAGVGGSSPLESRPRDTFGVGYSFVAYSTPVKNLAPVLLPIRDEHAVEVFYNIAVTPWFRVTPDLQFLVPAREQTLPPGVQPIDTAVVAGIRAKVDF